jgi:hypothetical protein
MEHLDPQPPIPRTEISAAELVREAMADAKQLVRLEVELAREEVKRELSAVRTGAITVAASALVLVLGLALLLVAMSLAIFAGPIPALLIGLILLAISGLAATIGFKLLPKKPLEATRKRLEADVEVVKERIAKERMV